MGRLGAGLGLGFGRKNELKPESGSMPAKSTHFGEFQKTTMVSTKAKGKSAATSLESFPTLE
jgi:hypothetical protein